MSIIPKIRVSKPTQRQKDNLSFDCSTTANFGQVQPTMCRELVPDESLKVKVSSLVRLASMPVPTFGRLHLRHYHAFVSYENLWEAFNAFLSQQHFTPSAITHVSFIPQQVWRFNLSAYIESVILNCSYMSVFDRVENDYVRPDGNDYSYLASVLNTIAQNVDSYHFSAFPSGDTDRDLGSFRYVLYNVNNPLFDNNTAGFCFDGVVCNVSILNDAGEVHEYYNEDFKNVEAMADYARDWPNLVTFESADFILENSRYFVTFKLNPLGRHLRKVFIGLGYQFQPFFAMSTGSSQTQFENVFKLLAYYKTWFEYFCPQRERGFQDTLCYNFIKYSSELAPVDVNLVNFTGSYNYMTIARRLEAFLDEMAKDTYYYLPSDYFSMAIQQPSLGNSDLSTIVNTPVSQDYVGEAKAFNSSGGNGVSITDGYDSPLVQKLAQKLLTFTNKNTVIGRNVREYLKTHFGVVDEDNIDTGGLVKIGVSDVNIQISDVMSTAENEQGFLGEYGGKGIGYKESESFDYYAKKFGCWITLSVIIPQSGYYQGTLRENTHKERFDFFTPAWDALGYQVLERRELMNAYTCKSTDFNPNTAYEPLSAFGFVPRYSEYKVGRNIVNGDLSLRGMPSMAAYTFDRKLPTEKLWLHNQGVPGSVPAVAAPTFMPTVIFDGFRKVGENDDFGQYNRIFNVTSNIVDHFIIHNLFDVSAIAPWKSLSDSFDTFVEGEDLTEVSHS